MRTIQVKRWIALAAVDRMTISVPDDWDSEDDGNVEAQIILHEEREILDSTDHGPWELEPPMTLEEQARELLGRCDKALDEFLADDGEVLDFESYDETKTNFAMDALELLSNYLCCDVAPHPKVAP